MRSESKSNDIFDKLDKSNTFSAIELEYLEEFVEVLNPIATALDYIQGNNCYYGILRASSMSVRRLDRLQDSNLRHFTFNVRVLQLKKGLGKRFNVIFKKNEHFFFNY